MLEVLKGQHPVWLASPMSRGNGLPRLERGAVCIWIFPLLFSGSHQFSFGKDGLSLKAFPSIFK